MRLALGLLERPARIERSILWDTRFCYSMVEVAGHIGGLYSELMVGRCGGGGVFAKNYRNGNGNAGNGCSGANANVK
jgi:hypothetical protein